MVSYEINLVYPRRTPRGSKWYQLESPCNAFGQLLRGQEHFAILWDRNFYLNLVELHPWVLIRRRCRLFTRTMFRMKGKIILKKIIGLECVFIFITNFFFIRSDLNKNYLFFDLFDLFFESLVFLLGWLVLFSEFICVDITSATQHSFEVVNSISWFLWFFIELNKNLCQLINSSCSLQVLLEFLFFSFDSSLF